MRQIFTIGLATLLLAGNAWAQAELVKKKADQIRDANNARQAAIASDPTAPAPPAAPAQAAVPATPQGINPNQQQLIDRLESDFAVVKTGGTATAAQKQSMVNEMTALTRGVAKPTAPALTKLAADLSQALAEKSLPPADTALLAKDVNIVMNCASLAPARVQTYVSEAQTALRKNGVSDASAQAVGADLRAVVAEIQKSKPKPSP